jgi:hypothetical protein
MRNHDIEPLHARDFIVIAVLTAAVLLAFWGTVSTIGHARQNFEVMPVVAR